MTLKVSDLDQFFNYPGLSSAVCATMHLGKDDNTQLSKAVKAVYMQYGIEGIKNLFISCKERTNYVNKTVHLKALAEVAIRSYKILENSLDNSESLSFQLELNQLLNRIETCDALFKLIISKDSDFDLKENVDPTSKAKKRKIDDEAISYDLESERPSKKRRLSQKNTQIQPSSSESDEDSEYVAVRAKVRNRKTIRAIHESHSLVQLQEKRGRHSLKTEDLVNSIQVLIENFPPQGQISEQKWSNFLSRANLRVIGRNTIKRGANHLIKCPAAPETVRKQAEIFIKRLVNSRGVFKANETCEYCKPI